METLTIKEESTRKLQIIDKKKVAESLSKRVVRGGIWMFSLQIASRMLSLVSTVILAHLLAPDDFGLMGIALLAMGTIETFSQTGFERALVQRKGEIKEFLDTTWVSLIIRGIMISAILYFSAPLLGTFFNAPKAIDVIKVIALIPLINGIANIGVVYFQRELEFRKRFLYKIGGSFTGTIVTVYLAFLFRNVWALVYGALAGCLAEFVLSYLIHPYRPKFKFDWEKTRELFNFGKWIFILSIIVFLITYVDNALVGKLLGITSLGFYTMAYKFSNLPCTEIGHVVSQVSFPAYSKLQDDLPKLREAYLKVLQAVTFMSIPIAGGIFILGPEFTKIFLGDKWIPMIGALRLLCIVGALRAVQNTYGVFAGIGKPKIGTKITALTLGFMALTIYPLTVKFAIIGTAMALIISFFLSTCYGAWQVHHILDLDYSKFSKVIILPILGVFVFTLLISLIQSFPSYKVNMLSFSSLVVFLGIIYLGTILLLDRLINYELRSLSSLFFDSLKLER